MELAHPAMIRSKRWKNRLLSVLVLVGLLILTTWNVTRSSSLLDARRAEARGDFVHCLQSALDHLNRQPWSGEAALLVARCLSRLDYAAEAEPYFERAGHLSLNDLQIRANGLARGFHPEQAIPVYNEIALAYRELGQPAKAAADLQKTIMQLRKKPAVSSPVAKSQWPRYAL
jgi:tetratricopeptide (TPR) repeat protein